MGVNDERTMHMLFLGNPGTGKTTIARLVARMLASLGMLKKGQLIEVTRKVRSPTVGFPHSSSRMRAPRGPAIGWAHRVAIIGGVAPAGTVALQ